MTVNAKWHSAIVYSILPQVPHTGTIKVLSHEPSWKGGRTNTLHITHCLLIQEAIYYTSSYDVLLLLSLLCTIIHLLSANI